MHDYSEGDRVAIVLDGGQQMGMPHRRFHGRTGFIQKRQGVAWVVAVKDGNMQKTVIARPEHLRPLECDRHDRRRQVPRFCHRS